MSKLTNNTRTNWAEFALKPGQKYRIFCRAPDGKGKGFCLRTYIKGGTAVFHEEEDTSLEELPEGGP